MKVTKDNVQEVFDDLSWDDQEKYKNLLSTKSLKGFSDKSRTWSEGEILLDGDGEYFLIVK